MRVQTMLILGGYGGAGKALAELLLKETELRVFIGERNHAKAEAFASELNARFSGHWPEVRTFDANRSKTLLPVFQRSQGSAS